MITAEASGDKCFRVKNQRLLVTFEVNWMRILSTVTGQIIRVTNLILLDELARQALVTFEVKEDYRRKQH
jgi:hypothetical protein